MIHCPKQTSTHISCDIFSRKKHGRKEQFHVAKVHYSHEWKGWNMKEVSRPSSSSPSSPPSSPSSPPSSASGAAICFLSSQPTLLEINLLYHLSSFSLIPASLVEEDGEAGAADKVQHRLTQIMFYIFLPPSPVSQSVGQWLIVSDLEIAKSYYQYWILDPMEYWFNNIVQMMWPSKNCEASNAQNYHWFSHEQSKLNFVFSSFPICQMSTHVKDFISMMAGRYKNKK